jgi:hypothetical protein
MEGRIVVSLSVGSDGTVDWVCAATLVGLSEEVAGCVGDVLHHAQFSAPTSGHATINVPVTFIQQKK